MDNCGPTQRSVNDPHYSWEGRVHRLSPQPRLEGGSQFVDQSLNGVWKSGSHFYSRGDKRIYAASPLGRCPPLTPCNRKRSRTFPRTFQASVGIHTSQVGGYRRCLRSGEFPPTVELSQLQPVNVDSSIVQSILSGCCSIQ